MWGTYWETSSPILPRLCPPNEAISSKFLLSPTVGNIRIHTAPLDPLARVQGLILSALEVRCRQVYCLQPTGCELQPSIGTSPRSLTGLCSILTLFEFVSTFKIGRFRKKYLDFCLVPFSSFSVKTKKVLIDFLAGRHLLAPRDGCSLRRSPELPRPQSHYPKPLIYITVWV